MKASASNESPSFFERSETVEQASLTRLERSSLICFASRFLRDEKWVRKEGSSVAPPRTRPCSRFIESCLFFQSGEFKPLEIDSISLLKSFSL